MTEPATAAAAGSAAASGAGASAFLSYFGLPLGVGALASGLGFLLLWPASAKEAAVRLSVTVFSSCLIGPLLVAVLHSQMPEIFTSAEQVAAAYGLRPLVGILMLSAPVFALAGLPSWWILGGVVRWLDRRKGQDIGEMAKDAAATIKEIRRGD